MLFYDTVMKIPLPKISQTPRTLTPVEDLNPFPTPQGPPPASLRQREVLGIWQLARLATAAPRLSSASRGDGSMVIDIPGWRAPEASLWPVRAFLRAIGWSAHGWGLGANKGDVEGYTDRMTEKVASIYDRTGAPVSLVGWSLGGVIAREVAREVPHLVRSVATYGTPVVGGPRYTIGASFWNEEECERISRLTEELDSVRPIEVPVTAIYSRRDGIVSWPACIDRSSTNVRHFEVGSSHLGLGIDPDVLGILAESLTARHAVN